MRLIIPSPLEGKGQGGGHANRAYTHPLSLRTLQISPFGGMGSMNGTSTFTHRWRRQSAARARGRSVPPTVRSQPLGRTGYTRVPALPDHTEGATRDRGSGSPAPAQARADHQV